MAQESREIGEGIDAAEPAGGNEAHEEIRHPRSPKGLEEQRVLPMKDAQFEYPFANVVIQGGVGDPEKKRQSGPVLEHIPHGLAHGGVWFNGVLGQLALEPFFEVSHEGALFSWWKASRWSAESRFALASSST